MVPEPTNRSIERLLEHAGWLDELARRLVSDRHEADEIVQDTWIAALTHPPQRATNLRGWLARVARNLAVQRGRSDRARKLREQSTANQESSTADHDAVERARTLRRLVDAVLALDEPYRSTLVLHYFERLTITEVAARQSVPESTVRTRMWRAIGMLRERFRHEDGDSWSFAFVALVSKHTASPHIVTSAAAAGTSGALIGGIAMATAWKVGASIAAVIVLGWALWPKHDDSIVRGLDVARGPDPSVETLSVDGDTKPVARVAMEAPQPVGQVDASTASTAPKPDRAALDVHMKWGDDGTPAVGVVVSLWQFGAPDPKHEQTAHVTDADGAAHFDDVFPGSTSVQPDRCEGKLVKLAAGEKGACDLVIPDGIDVDVHVVDENATAVPRARIWVSAYGNDDQGQMIGTADASGRYRVRDLGPGRTLAALRDDFGPSAQERIEAHAPGSRVDVELVMTTPIGRVRGTVRDRSNAPIAGALVELTNREAMFTVKPKPGRSSTFPPMRVVTDVSGAFDARDVGRGKVEMVVSAHGFATLHQLAGAGPEGEPLDVRVDIQAVVHGTLRDEKGEPLSKARVSYTDEAYWGTLNDTSSRADGSYVLACLPAGSVELRMDAGQRGEARRTFDLKAGDDVVWDVTVHPNPNVTGKVVDEAGKPLVGWNVNAVNPDPPQGGLRKSHALRSAHTNAQGAFEIENWPIEAVALQVCEPGKTSDQLSVQKDGVKGGDHDIVITVSPNDMHSSSIRGRVIEENGSPLSAAIIRWHRKGVNQYLPVKIDADGRFRAEALQPGSYDIEVTAENLPARTLSDLNLVREQELDVGDVRISGAGNLKVRLHVPPELKPDQGPPSLTLFKPGAKMGLGVHWNGDIGTLDGIEPGAYELKLFSPWVRAPVTNVNIELHRTTEVEITAEIATSRGVKLVVPEGSTPYKLITLRAFDSTGAVVYTSEYPPTIKNALVANLILGTYRIEATSDTGLVARETLKIDSMTIPQTVIELHLR